MGVRNVLVFPAGTEIGLEIHRALQPCKEVRLFGASSNASNHGPFVFARYHLLPAINEAGWLDALVELCKSLAIDYIFPAYDDVLVALAEARAAIPAAILTAPTETCRLTRSKRRTYEFLHRLLRVPAIYDAIPDTACYPLIVKPDRGQGSQGVTLVRSADELTRACTSVRDPIVCEYLPGEEYTVDCFSDRRRGLLFAGARIRQRTRNGIAVNTAPVVLEGLEDMAQRIHAALDMRGAWFFQLKRAADGTPALLEVAPRIAGAMCLHRVSGVNFPLLTIFEEERIELEIALTDGLIEVDRALCNRFRHRIAYSALYIDLDDTLLLAGQINLAAIRLIFQCRNKGRKVVLITRHAGDLAATLARLGLTGVFNDIIHLRDGEPKSLHIAEPDAILVDDSFRERREARLRLGIRTFDPSMIEMLTEEAPEGWR